MKRQSQTAELADLILKHRDDPKTPWRGSGHYEGIARGLVRAAKELSRIAERQCSENMPEAVARRVEAREAYLEAHVRRLAATIDVGVTFSGDPRGYCVKLHFGPSPKEQPGNSWGGAECGWGIG